MNILELKVILDYIINRRFRNDIKSINLAKKTYAYRGWELCESTGLDYNLSRGVFIKDLYSEVNNKDMLEALLDFLTGMHVLNYNKNIYKFNKKPKDISNAERVFLEKRYNGSIKWSELLYEHAPKALIKGESQKMTGFFSRKAVELWDSVMDGPLYSLRKIGMINLLNGLKGCARIADIGCGSGIAIEDMIRISRQELDIIGFDSSKEMLKKADERLNKLNFEKLNYIQKSNLSRVHLINQDIEKSYIKKGFNAIFLSLVINHIPKEKRNEFFRHIKTIMNTETKLVIFQLINQDKFNRVFSDWLMYVVPTHCGFPFKNDFFNVLKNNFSQINSSLKGVIIEAKI